MTLSGKDVVARSDDFEERAAAYELRPWQWAFLHEIDGAREVRDVAFAGGVDLDLATDFIAESEAAGLVHVISMSLRDYRAAHGIAAPEAAPAEDTLGGYGTAVPAWMIEHHEHHEMPEPVAQHSAPEPVADYAAEPVAEHAEPMHEWQPDPHVADYAAEPVAEHAEPMHEWQPDTYVADYAAEPVAEHAEPMHDWQPDWQPDTYVAEAHAAPVAFEIGGEHPTDAGPAVADLMSLDHHAAEPMAEPSTNGHAVSLSFGDESDAALPEHSTNGHATMPSWEPMSLVTTVDDIPPAHDEPTYEFSDGVAHAEASHAEAAHAEPAYEAAEPVAEHDAPHAEVSPELEQGSIAFSFHPDMMAPIDAAPAERPAPIPETPNAPMSPPPQQQLQMTGPPAQNGKSDLVGSLIARAFTFRIK